jgi:hypothetical protein
MRALVWVREDASGAEFCAVRLEGGSLRAAGVALGGRPLPYRLEYELATDENLVTKRVRLRSAGDTWRRELDLDHDGAGSWKCRGDGDGAVGLSPAGGDPMTVEGALDCDIAFSPLTNTMPILREQVRAGRACEIVAAWIAVPDLALVRSLQRYEPVDGERVRYRSGSFAAVLELDADGFVRDYPGLARRVETAP